MPLYTYKKAPVRRSTNSGPTRFARKSSVVVNIEKQPLTLWKILSGISNDLTKLFSTSTLFGTILPTLLIIYGVNLLLSQIIPAVVTTIQEKQGNFEQTTISIVPASAVSAKQAYLSNPGSAYFEQIQNSANAARVLEQDPVAAEYTGRFEISIPSLNLNNLPVQANTESGVEEVYDRVLESGLAHMESTGLPISPVNNNIVIYGHSAGGNYFKRTGDPAAAFSQLTNIKLGDEINVKIDGKEFAYRVKKTKIVDPTDLSILAGEGNPNSQPLTLFTCYPPGNNANRYVVSAVPVS